MTAHRPRGRRARTGVLALLFPMLALPVPSRAEDSESTSIVWRSDYGQALTEAQRKGLPLWIQFTAPWCPSCVRMEQESFPDPAIRDHAERSFVPLKLRSDVNEELALGFGLSGLPASVIVAPSREVLAVRQGYLGPRELADLLRGASPQAKEKADEALAATTRSASSSGEPAKADAKPATARPKTENRLALSGFCPVSLVSDKRLVAGQTAYTVLHEGRLYRFANLLTFNRFRRDPQRYAPANGGNCPVTEVEQGLERAGDPKLAALYKERLFLFASPELRQRFLKEPARFAVAGVDDDGHCPHCLKNEGLPVRGDPRFDLSQGGRWYWFPDESHREAFLAATREPNVGK